MAGTRSTRRWTLAVLALCLLGTVALHQTRGWVWLGVAPIGDARVPFSDAAAQLSAADACAGGFGQRIARVCFLPDADTEVHAQTWEPWLTFQRWGLGGKHYIAISFAMIGLFYLAFCLAFKPAGAGEAALVLALLFSAAVQLAVERANFDLLTSALLCLAAWLLSARRSRFAAAGCVVLGVATGLKLYTGLSCAGAWLVRRPDRARIALIAVLCTAAVIALLGPASIAALGHGAPQGATRFSTGAHWLLRHRGFAWMAAAATLALLVSATAWRAMRRYAPALARCHPRRTALLQIAFLTAIPLFLLKDSYDYRFVLWLPCLALPLALLRRPDLAAPWRGVCSAILALSVLVFCAELPCALLERHASGAAAAALIEGLTLLRQFAVWTLAGLLSVLFVRSLTEPSVKAS